MGSLRFEGLTTAGFYGPLGSDSHENKKNFSPNLTNGHIDRPLKIHDGYGARSEIENSMFREAKQAWFIQRAPENTTAGFLAHVYLTVLIMTLTTAFQIWMDQQDKLELSGENTASVGFVSK